MTQKTELWTVRWRNSGDFVPAFDALPGGTTQPIMVVFNESDAKRMAEHQTSYYGRDDGAEPVFLGYDTRGASMSDGHNQDAAPAGSGEPTQCPYCGSDAVSGARFYDCGTTPTELIQTDVCVRRERDELRHQLDEAQRREKENWEAAARAERSWASSQRKALKLERRAEQAEAERDWYKHIWENQQQTNCHWESKHDAIKLIYDPTRSDSYPYCVQYGGKGGRHHFFYGETEAQAVEKMAKSLVDRGSSYIDSSSGRVQVWQDGAGHYHCRLDNDDRYHGISSNSIASAFNTAFMAVPPSSSEPPVGPIYDTLGNEFLLTGEYRKPRKGEMVYSITFSRALKCISSNDPESWIVKPVYQCSGRPEHEVKAEVLKNQVKRIEDFIYIHGLITLEKAGIEILDRLKSAIAYYDAGNDYGDDSD